MASERIPQEVGGPEVGRGTTAQRLREDLIGISRGTPATVERELLHSVDTADGMFERFATLAGLGIDRVHVRPRDELTQAWLTESLPRLQAL